MIFYVQFFLIFFNIQSKKWNEIMVKNNDHIEESPVKQDKRKSHKNKLILVIIAIVIGLFISQKIYVFKITSSTMLPTLKSGQFVVAVKKKEIKQEDLIAFWHGDKLLVKRVIAGPGDKVEIDMKGNVSVNDKKINEPYINKKVLGKSDISFPHSIDKDHWFCMGDNRKLSIDSRTSMVSDISKNQIEGTIILRIWPINKFRIIQ